MPKFLIEVPHEADPLECAIAVQIFLKTGSHFLSHADWGCMDGSHKAWLVVDVGSKEEARMILPPAFRSKATIVTLNRFSLQEVEGKIARYHPETN